MLHKALGNHYNDGDIPRNLRLSDDNDATENILFAILDYNWKNGICKTRILQETDLTIKRLAYISPILTFAQVDGSLHLFDMEDMTSYRLHERLPRKQEITSIAMTFSTRPDNTSSLIQHSTGQWQEIYNDAELVPSFTLDELKSILDEDTLAEFHRNNEQVEMLLASEQPPQPGSGDDEDDEEDVNTMTMMNEEDVHFATSFDEEKSFHNLALEVDNSLSYYHIAMGTSEGEVILYKYVPAPSLVVGHEALDDEIKALEVLQYAYQRHTKSITGLYFYAIPNTTEDNKTMPTQEMMISCSQDRVLLAVDIHSGDLLWRRELSSIPNCMVGNEQYVAIGQSNGSIVIYDVLKGEAMFAVSRNGRASTTNSIDGKSIGKEMSSVRSLHFVSDTVLLAGYQDGHVLR